MSQKRIKLSELIELKYGKGLPERDRKLGPYAVYGSNGMVGRHSSFLLDKQTIVVGRKGSIGEITLTEQHSWPIDTTYYVHILDERRLDLLYLFYYLRTLNLKRLDTSSAVPGINRKFVLDLSIPLPPVEIQEKVATLLQRADDLGQTRQKANQLTSKIIQSIFLKIFGDPISNENHWPVKTIREAAEKVSDGPFGSNLKTEHYTADGVRVVRLQNIGVGEFLDGDKAYISLDHYSKIRKHTCVPGDVIVGTLGDPNLRACILPSHVEIAVNKADCIQIRPNKDVLIADYLCQLLNTPQMLSLASSYLHGETRTRISMSQVASLLIPIPPISIQRNYAQIVTHFERVRTNQNQSTEEIDQLFNSLVQKAFRGELVKVNIA